MLFIHRVIKFNTRAEILTKKLALGLLRVWFICQDAAPENSRVELLFLACWDIFGLALFNFIQRAALSPYRTAEQVPAKY